MALPDGKNPSNYPIPTALNIFVLFFAIAISILSLGWAAHGSILFKILGVLLFANAGNTLFSLLHEATHGNFARSRFLNRWGGRLSAAFFPTAFSLQQLYHLGHHRRNRTDAEMFDLYYPDDNLLVKKIVIYGIVGGLYWITPMISCLVFLINPQWVLSEQFKDHKIMKAISADHMLGGLDRALMKPWIIRLEILFTLGVQFSLIHFLNLSFGSWLACYWIFGIYWGSLQYADHVNSKRDIREGAWNLKVNGFTQKVFLNYHYHLVHHRYPFLAWVHLPKFVDPNDPMPTYREKLWEFLSGPRPATSPSPTLQKGFEAMIYKNTIYEDQFKN